jgi:hypothetical protein
MFLAMKLGLPVHEMLARHTSEELTEWMAYFLLEQEDTKPGQSPVQQIATMKAAGHG